MQNAQAVRDFSHIRLSYVVPFYLNQRDTGSLDSLLRTYAAYPAGLLDVLQFVMVDDGSPVAVSIPDDLDLNLLVLRVKVDIPWNQPGARNLGVMTARSDKVLVTDLDHEFSAETLACMVRMPNPGRTMYKMRRVKANGGAGKPHPNTFLLSRARFLRFYGYDEDFCGHYGFDDSMFWRWQRYNGTRFACLPRTCISQTRRLNLDDAYHSLERDLSHNAALATRKRALWKEYGPQAGHSRRFVSFPWEPVVDRQRSTRPAPGRQRLWASTWWWRGIMGGPGGAVP